MATIKQNNTKQNKITSVHEDVEKLEPLYMPDENAERHSGYEKVCGVLKKPEPGLAYDPAIPLLGTYLSKRY